MAPGMVKTLIEGKLPSRAAMYGILFHQLVMAGHVLCHKRCASCRSWQGR